MEDGQVVHSPNDTRKYRVIRLENGLKAILVSDPLPPEELTDTSYTPPADNDDVISDSSTEETETESESESESGSECESKGETKNVTNSTILCRKGRCRRKVVVGGGTQSVGKAAVCLCVAVGSYSDPEDVPGLAHFLEHMVFMGSKKYPKESGMDSYLADHGGDDDAFTEAEHTVFSFDVEQKHFEGALDRFAHFFIDPLLRKDAIDREIKAVDSEFEIAVPSDKNRVEQLLGTIARNTHPMSKFLWGNADTLRTQPKAAGIDVHASLESFRRTFYTAQNMTVAVQASKTLDELEFLIRKTLSKIHATLDPKPSFIHLNPPYDMSSFNKMIKVIPNSHVNRLLLTWCLPSVQPHYRSKPLTYLGFLLGHQGTGSISAYLSKRHWKYDLEAGCEESETFNNSCCCVFKISMTLSDDGLGHMFEVVTTIFEYLAMLRSKGPVRHLFEEIKSVEDSHFQWTDKGDAQQYVQQLAMGLQLYRPEDCLRGATVLMDFNEQLISDCTNALTPDKMNLMVLSRSFLGSPICDQQCKWFKTRYGCEEIPIEWIRTWAAIEPPGPDGELHLPLPNKFLASDFTLKDEDDPKSVSESEFPLLISESAVSKVWYRKDQTFKVPHAVICIYFSNSCIVRSVTSTCLAELFIEYVEQRIVEDTYDAHSAGLSFSMKVEDDGIVIKLSGFSEKIEQLLQIILNHFVDVKFNNREFESAIDRLKKSYNDISIKASNYNEDLYMAALDHSYWRMTERLTALANVSMKDLGDYYNQFLSSFNVQMLFQGNIKKQEAIDLNSWILERLDVNKRLPCSSSASSAKSDNFVTELPVGFIIHRLKNYNDDDDNCCISNIFQHGPATLRQRLLNKLLIGQMSTPLFDSLRTKRQLGYDVSCSSVEMHGTIGLLIQISSQSQKFSMLQLNNGIKKFLEKFEDKITAWKNESFKEAVQVLSESIMRKAINLEEEVSWNWRAVVDDSGRFDRKQREVDCLKDLTVKEYRVYSIDLLSSLTQRSLSVQVTGTRHVPVKDEELKTSGKRSGSKMGGKKKKRRKECPRKHLNRDKIPKNGKDDYIFDLAAFKAKCKKFKGSRIV